MVYKSTSHKKTQKIAGDLARKIIKTNAKRHAQVIALEGELGAGKTTFVRGFARALGIKEKISSPTFLILRKFEIRNSKFQKNAKYKILNTKYSHLIHIDAYRLRDYRDLVPLGIKEIFADPRNIVLIEWAERVRKILPRKCIKVHIDHLDQTTRKIEVSIF